ncbi:hypothetical protein FA13DRAFT_1799805 [Coprinellus micaceus]|uniref:RRM domain-containing protein n=1 Tax=Coprinellus micaceus TaxID=71717 RepID=A0A4Y7SHX7_COPMI|nr:hypothetical protein FA13DRAFT_1799805 [Coprinellus micaceus]
MAHVLNATLRLSQRTSTRKVSHVLSGSTRSLSSTSSPAVRGCAARNASFVTAFSTPRYTSVFSSARAFSTKPEEVEERAESAPGGIKETPEQTQTEQPEHGETEKPRRRAGQHHRVQAPSKTLFVGRLPFFATEEDVRKVFEGCGTITAVNIHDSGRQRGYPPNAFVTMSSIQEATTIFESARQEPYVLEGRTLLVNWSIDKQFNTPSKFIYFKNFNNGDLGQLREFLGDLSGAVDSAYFVRDKRKPNAWAPSGMIICRDTESATEIIAACHGRPGLNGSTRHSSIRR